jgi:hypothetical protein
MAQAALNEAKTLLISKLELHLRNKPSEMQRLKQRLLWS